MSGWVNYYLFGVLGMATGGVTIGSIMVNWRDRRIRLSDAQTLEDILAMSPEAFEALIAELFRRYGYRTESSSGSSDHGVDILVFNEQDEKWVVQCKRYSHSVGEPILRDLYGTMLHEEASKAYLFTTGWFTRQAIAWADGKPIILYDGVALINLIKRADQARDLA
jgi:restriction system protein